jgi:hypothetical protein
MQVFRFMSEYELLKYLHGKELHNNTRHQAKTDSIGFCFFDMNDVTPEYAWKFLKGAIFPDICVVFEVDEKILKKGYGIYSDPEKTLYELMNFIPKAIKVPEYSVTKYDNKTFKIIKYTMFKLNIFEQYEEFKWMEVHKQ